MCVGRPVNASLICFDFNPCARLVTAIRKAMATAGHLTDMKPLEQTARELRFYRIEAKAFVLLQFCHVAVRRTLMFLCIREECEEKISVNQIVVTVSLNFGQLEARNAY